MGEIETWFERQIGTSRAAQPSSSAFPLASTLAPSTGLPESVTEACEFFRRACFDWGGAWVHRQAVGDREIFYVHVGTDGDTGWLEVFDLSGGFLMSAFLDGNRVTWEDRAVARGRIPSE